MNFPGRTYRTQLLIVSTLTIISVLVRIFTIWPGMALWQQVGLSFYTFILLWVIWSSLDYINRFLNRKIPFARNPPGRIAVQFLCNWTLLMVLRWSNIFMFRNRLPFELDWLNYSMIFLIDLFLAIGITLAFSVYFFLMRWKESIIRTERLEKEKTMMQIHNLRNRVNPHFLFNALSALDGLIKTRPELASRFLQHLSKVYRYSLQNEDRECVSLDTEYGVFRHFMSLLEIRYGPALVIDIRLDADVMDRGIVPLTLEMLSENALKHNEVSAGNPLYISIRNENNTLVVENTLRPKRTMETSNGKGLQQLESLYGWLSEEPFSAGKNQDKFIVKLPLL